MSEATFVIGDVHGCVEELYELLDTLTANNPTAKLAFVGDYIDKGPNPAKAADTVRGLVRMGRAVALLGNHEEKAIRKYKRGEDIALGELSADLVAWFETLPIALRIPTGELLVHGGVYPKLRDIEPFIGKPIGAFKGKEKRIAHRILRARHVNNEGQMVSIDQTEPGMPHWAEVYDGRFGKIVFGHDPTAPEGKYAYPVDRGCVNGGRLEALYVRPAGLAYERMSVEARKVYCPSWQTAE